MRHSCTVLGTVLRGRVKECAYGDKGSAVLLVLSGLIAGGKSAVASVLAAAYRVRGRSAAVLARPDVRDADRRYPRANVLTWRRARRLSGAIAEACYDGGFEVVIIDGPFWEPEARVTYTQACAVEPSHGSRSCALVSTKRCAAQADPTRGLSPVPTFLAQHHAGLDAAPLNETDVVGVVTTDNSARPSPAASAARRSNAQRRLGAAGPLTRQDAPLCSASCVASRRWRATEAHRGWR